jgi:hypothetical protein
MAGASKKAAAATTTPADETAEQRAAKARVSEVGSWLSAELATALQGRPTTVQRLLQAVQQASQAGGPLSDDLGAAFAVTMLAGLTPPPAAESTAPDTNRPPEARRKHTII